MDAALKRREGLDSAGVRFDRGLAESEIEVIEERFGFVFPLDLREFLAEGLPVSSGWVDWRNGDETSIRNRLELPYEGICFDIEHNEFWLKNWGAKPRSLEACFTLAKHLFDSAPMLIPIYSHRYIPDCPRLPGNPVFSVHQTDIIHYGSNLQNYFENEFHYYFNTPDYNLPEPIRRIDFWTTIVEDNC